MKLQLAAYHLTLQALCVVNDRVSSSSHCDVPKGIRSGIAGLNPETQGSCLQPALAAPGSRRKDRKSLRIYAATTTNAERPSNLPSGQHIYILHSALDYRSQLCDNDLLAVSPLRGFMHDSIVRVHILVQMCLFLMELYPDFISRLKITLTL